MLHMAHYIFPHTFGTQGKPVNLSGNCSKHILAELKHAHVDDVECATIRKSQSKPEIVDAIAPPPWSASVLTPVLDEMDKGSSAPNTAGTHDSHDDGDSNSDSDLGLGVIEGCAESDSHPSAALNRINQHVRQLGVRTGRQKAIEVSAADHCMEAVRRVSSTLGDTGIHLKGKKRPRGNAAFFHHMSATQASISPKRSEETVSDFRKRVAETARATWVNLDTCVWLIIWDCVFFSYNSQPFADCLSHLSPYIM